MRGGGDTERSGERQAEARVASEWLRLERARIDGEIAEAREDAETAEQDVPARRPIRWSALVAAFLAGVVVTVVLNRFLATRRAVEPADQLGAPHGGRPVDQEP